MTTNNNQPMGFTLIELMTVIAIIGILSAVALPQYAQYTKRSKFSGVVVGTSEYKSAVHLCVQELNTLTGCSNGSNGIPNAIQSTFDYMQSVTVVDGLITATANSDLDGKDFILTPSYTPTENVVRWVSSGSCYAAKLC